MLAEVETKYPLIEVDLSHAAGDGVAMMSQMRVALRAGQVPAREISAFFDEALSQGNEALLATCARWVRVKPILVVVQGVPGVGGYDAPDTRGARELAA